MRAGIARRKGREAFVPDTPQEEFNPFLKGTSNYQDFIEGWEQSKLRHEEIEKEEQEGL